MRGSVMVAKQMPYVDGARARGRARARRADAPRAAELAWARCSSRRTVLWAFAIQIEAALSFLGLGAQPPTPSLGVMLSDGRDVLTQAPWVEVFPGLAIAI